MRVAIVRRVVVLVIVALALAGCEEEKDPVDAGQAGGTGSAEQLPSPGYESPKPQSPSPRLTLMPPATSCPVGYRQVKLYGTDLQARLNLMGFMACSDGTGGMWLSNGALVPWVIEQPVLEAESRITDPQRTLFREALTALPVGGLVIEPGEALYFAAEPTALALRVDAGVSAMWQVLTAMKNAAEGRAKDGLAQIASRGSPVRRAVIDCASAAWDAGKAAESSAQQAVQTPTMYVHETIGLGRQVGDCGRALQELERRQPPQQLLLTADDLSVQLRRPQVAEVIDEAVTGLPKLCASLPRC